MNELQRDLIEFHLKYGATIHATPTIPDNATVALRCKLIDEEYRELIDAIGRNDVASIAKEAVDLIYVTVGTLVAYGISLMPVWRAVHHANLSKDGGLRGDAKVLKGDGYKAPNIAGLLAVQEPIISYTEAGS
jgi:predicted HAD superfamily Cof-like phosphohydrolase